MGKGNNLSGTSPRKRAERSVPSSYKTGESSIAGTKHKRMKSRGSRAALVALVLSLLAALALAACSGTDKTGESAPLRTSTAATDVQPVVTRVLSAMAAIRSFHAEADITDDYSWSFLNGNSGGETYSWKSSKTFDVAARQMEMTITIDRSGISAIRRAAHQLDLYFNNGWEYVHAMSSSGNPWTKRALTDDIWARESQLSYYTGFMKTATNVALGPTETFNGVDCLVLNVTPSAAAATDWAVSQQRSAGESNGDIMYGGATPVVRPDAYHAGSIRLWIDSATYLPLKAEFDVTFEGPVGGGSGRFDPTTSTISGEPVTSRFHGLVTFSACNQPVSIELPAEALNAEEVITY